MAEPVIHNSFLHATDGTRLNVLHAGSASASRPVIAFIPGWSMPATIWTPQLLALGRHYKVVALDPRGQGASDVPRAGYTLHQRADDIRRFVDHAVDKNSRVVLVAWSLGALETLEFLHRGGSVRVAGLVIVDSSVGEGPAPAPSAAGTTFSDALRRDRNQALTDFIQAIFHSPQPRPQLEVLRKAALRMPLEASLSLFPSQIPREHWKSIVHQFRPALLYVVTPQFAAQAQILKATRPGTRIEVLKQAGHALFVDEPVRFNALLEAFIQTIDNTGEP